MRVSLLLLLAMATVATAPARAQAPDGAALWRVAASSLAGPPALERGAVGAVWNPAAAHGAHRLGAGAQMVNTSDILGLSGLLVAVDHPVGRSLRLGLMAGRLGVRDLVRTTTSPSSVAGAIPVWEQFAGLRACLHGGWVQVGGSLRVHDSRFDAERESGFTIDLGLTATPTSRLRLAAATNFLPIDLAKTHTTDLYGAIEYVVARNIPMGPGRMQLAARYGATWQVQGSVDHVMGVGVALNRQFRIDGAVAGESGLGGRVWRPSLAMAFTVGRYTISAARGSGVNEVGATYRVGLEAAIGS